MLGTNFWEKQMNDAWLNFRKRREEVKQYVRFVYDLVKNENNECLNKESNNHSPSPKHTVDIRIHKATVLLLLYNLIESTTTSAIVAIYSKIKEDDVCFDNCSDRIKQVVLNNCRRHFNHSSWQVQNEIQIIKDQHWLIAKYLVYHNFNTNNILPGNVGLNELIDLADRYGFSNPASGYNFGFFSSIKDTRNDLAHGNKTFSEVGQSLGLDDIIRKYVQTIRLMRNTLKSVESFLQNNEHLANFIET